MRFLISLAVASLTLTGTANAQPVQQQHARKQATQVQPRQQTQRYTPPKSWRGTHTAYQAHIARCSKKYRSYNPRTDRYTVRGKQTAVCRL